MNSEGSSRPQVVVKGRADMAYPYRTCMLATNYHRRVNQGRQQHRTKEVEWGEFDSPMDQHTITANVHDSDVTGVNTNAHTLVSDSRAKEEPQSPNVTTGIRSSSFSFLETLEEQEAGPIEFGALKAVVSVPNPPRCTKIAARHRAQGVI